MIMDGIVGEKSEMCDGCKSECKSVDSRELFCCRQEVRVRHNGQEYRLFVTKNDKLILTK